LARVVRRMIWITMLEIIGAAQEARESPHSVTEEPGRPRPATGGTREGSQERREPWWRRIFGG
jgi:hypothetical protein